MKSIIHKMISVVGAVGKELPIMERRILVGLMVLLIGGIMWGGIEIRNKLTTIEPAEGGTYREGTIGQPRFINPLFAQSNDVDMDLTALMYTGLLKYTTDNKFEPDLATSLEISDDGRTYTVQLREDVLWHDGTPFTAADVEFTIATIQDPDTKSPLAPNFQNVTVEEVDTHTVRFILPDTYVPFRQSLTIGIIPKHIWVGIDPNNMGLAEQNLKPIGTGPFEFSELRRNSQGEITEYRLSRFEEFYGDQSYIDNIIFTFFDDSESLLRAFQRNRVDGVSSISPSRIAEIFEIPHAEIHRVRLPQYSAVFFNQEESPALSDRTVRSVLAAVVDHARIIQEALSGEGTEVNTPIPEGFPGHAEELKKDQIDIEEARQSLEEAEWIDEDGDGIRTKEDTRLSFNLITTTWPEYETTAKILAETWRDIGVEVNVETYDPGIIQSDVIRPRRYDALLYGNVLSADPDPYAFWHSSFTQNPGLNLAMYSNEEVDIILEDARTETDLEKRAELYRSFQESVVEDMPALFLYSPHYIYAIHESVGGEFVNLLPLPSYRFNTVSSWYVKTKRVLRR